MNRILLKATAYLALSMLFNLTVALNAHAQLAKQGNFEIKGIYTLTFLEKNKFDDFSLNAMNLTILYLNTSGGGILHNTSAKCEMISIPGDFVGYCVKTDLDGDHVFSKFEVVGGQLGTSGGGRKSTFVGGTGKYKGIEGGYTYSAIYGPNVDDHLIGHIVGSGSYKIP
jgi:hypothetical protein